MAAAAAVPISLSNRAFKPPADPVAAVKAEDDSKRVAMGARSLGALRPRIPQGGTWDDGGAAEREWTEQLSPRKKKGGYLV